MLQIRGLNYRGNYYNVSSYLLKHKILIVVNISQKRFLKVLTTKSILTLSAITPTRNHMNRHKWHPKLVENYLVKYYKNIDSREAARVYLKNFFTTMKEEPTQFLKKSKKERTDILWKYIEKIENRPPKTQNSMISFIKKFMVRHKVPIDEVEWEDMRERNNLKHSRSIVKKKTPTQQDLKKILGYATGVKSKALFVLCASSGLRIDEALSLTWSDIDMDQCKIELRDSTPKNEFQRVSFFTPEAKELLLLWKPERERLLQNMYKKSKYLRIKLQRMGYTVKKTAKGNNPRNGYYWHVYKGDKELTKEEIINIDNRVFPFDYVNANRMWVNLLNKAGKPYNVIDKNPKLKFKKYHYNIHSLRRFWYTQLMFDRANEEYINFMGGHTSELNQAYKFDDIDNPVLLKQLKEEYENHIGCLSIFETTPDLSGVHQELQEKDQQIKDMQQRIKDLEILKELFELKKEVEGLKNGEK